MQAVRRLLEAGILLATYLMIEFGLLALAKMTMDSHNEAIATVFRAIEVGSALGVGVLFAVHAVAVIIHYTRYLFVEDDQR